MRPPLRATPSRVVLATLSAITLAGPGVPAIVRAQQPITRAEAVAAARARGPRAAIAAADTAVAHAQLIGARAVPNPTLSAEYTRDTPQYHWLVDLPLDYPWLRSPRVASADAARRAARYRFAYEVAAAGFDADTSFTRALAADAHARLSRSNAQDADSLRRLAAVRRDAGDASELDVQLATVNAGQQENAAAADSLVLHGALLDLQTVIGLRGDAVRVALADSLGPPPADLPGATGEPLSVHAAALAVSSAELAVRTQRRAALPTPSFSGGVEARDPDGESGLLPTLGIGLSLPLFDRNRGAIAVAEADRQRANAELALARLESATRIARARRERDVALSRLERDRQLLESATRITAMSLTAYREGAASLPNVLEAQRTARDILGQYIDDLASAWIAIASLRLATLSGEGEATPE